MHEKRTTQRHSFGVEQMIADCVSDSLPPAEAFRPVRCIDISKDGVAFFQSERPAHSRLVIGLGIAPHIAYMVAQVVHVEMIELCGNLMFRVGCQFIGRADWSEMPEAVLTVHDMDDAFRFLSERASPQEELEM